MFNEIIDSCKESYHLKNYLKDFSFPSGNLYVISIGKAAFSMALQASQLLGNRITSGIVLTKYHHAAGIIPKFDIYEAGHPLVDENSLSATDKILKLTSNLSEDDCVICLISGGGSALFEKPIISLDQLQSINNILLKSGATINEINIIRKHLSLVKGGQFAKRCAPAKVYSYIISDVLGNDISSIASGPTSIDNSTINQAQEIADKYSLGNLPFIETVKQLDNCKNTIIADIHLLIQSTQNYFKQKGYQVETVTDHLSGEVKEAAGKIVSFALEHQNIPSSTVYLFAGEITVEVKGKGLGGRNQELVCRCIEGLSHCFNTSLISFSSDGTDGPTDATGGFIDQSTFSHCENLTEYLDNNDCYHLLAKLNQLIISGPTNININDITILIIHR